MNPTLPALVALSGPLKGRVFELTEVETSVGRGSANNVAIGDSSLSRRHCVIRREGDDFTLSDLGSRNGISVNGLPVQERRLAHGDQIALGESVFLFLLHEGEATSLVSPVQLSDDDLLKGLTVRLRREEARYPNAYPYAYKDAYKDVHQVGAALPSAARTARDLNTLLKISAAINSARNLAALESQLLALIAEAVPAEMGAILLPEEGSASEFAATFGWERRGGGGPARKRQPHGRAAGASRRRRAAKQ